MTILCHQNCTYLFGHFSHRRDRCSIKIVVILSSLYEQMILYIPLHLLPRRHEVIIPSIHFVFSSTPSSVCRQSGQRSIYSAVERYHKLVIISLLDNLRGTQLPNLSGNSEMRSSLMRSLSGPRTITGRVYCIVNCCTASYESTFSSLPVIV